MSHCLEFPPALPEHLEPVDETEARRVDDLDNCMLSQGIDCAQLRTVARPISQKLRRTSARLVDLM